ncbi:MAG: quinolinate synthase NadA [Acidobacteria bacterium]|nr:quinolinate synthase NadA [Acidobacteriota bacterium]
MDVELLTSYEQTQLGQRQTLPDDYLRLPDAEMEVRIAEAKKVLGDRLLILGHHYQRDEVFRFADVTGDSLKLAQQAAAHQTAEFVILCGVHFMAESADVLTGAHQKVILPDLAAGCSMADMAAIDQLEVCWSELQQLGATDVIPLTYINSTAAIKAFCGEHGGTVCTSGNASTILAWAWDRGEKVLMLPDEHLGRNTAFGMGVALDQMVVWDPHLPDGGVTRTELERARLILWKGHCSVHTRFSPQQVLQFRQQYPDGRVIAHPECTFETVQAADESGSTEHIIRVIAESPVGSVWAVATEIHLVHRLAHQLASTHNVLTLDALGCLCSTMFRVSPNHLLWILDGLVAGEIRNQISVPPEVRTWARVALDRMLATTSKEI